MYLTGIETRLPVSGGHGYDRSNCTLLELKLFSRDEVFKLGICSNCTLLELKRVIGTFGCAFFLVLIVPYWN